MKCFILFGRLIYLRYVHSLTFNYLVNILIVNYNSEIV